MGETAAQLNSAPPNMEQGKLEEDWDSEFSSVSPSEMTTDDKSSLPSPYTNQSTPFRVAAHSSTYESSECPETTSSIGIVCDFIV
ncbi:unnamed protein product [Strongylus vulgaris]|uniref:Uncharacterized protein n=1 Tax=Strongylus vulgaris TaxID=40348 RepID=A0A3P7J9X7_STRVU|nr:unnamed protein product [Strongylus vulgaris]